MSITEEVTFDNSGHIERFPLFRKLFLALVIILVAALSFGIGRLTSSGNRGGTVRIEYNPEISNSQFSISNSAAVSNAVSNIENSASVVTSSKGKKYYYLNCSGAKRIAEANKLIFPNATAAEAAGYSLASNCQP